MKEIKLTQSKLALIDDKDFEWLNQWKWYCNSYGYATRSFPKSSGKEKIFMHRLILNCSDNIEGDHIDGNRLNNQRYNLRICTKHQNSMNRKRPITNLSGYKGVSIKEGKYFYAQIKIDNKYIHLGCFSTLIDAAIAYNEAAKKHFGEFARLNNI